MDVERILSLLDHHFSKPEIPLQHTSSYTLLIAVLLSAQCTDERVNRVTPLLFALASTPEEMAQLSIETIRKAILPCGLSQRKAAAIHALSVILVERYGGRVPSSFEELEALPGVGHKTASVVRVQAFGLPAFPVDTHIFRCARRWGLSQGKTVAAVEADLKRLIPEPLWGKVHLQMILFARRYCPALRHDATSCPICSYF